MNPAHVHLLINHVPILGSIGGLILLAYGMSRNIAILRRTALVVIILSAIVAIPAYLTGEPSEDIVEKIPGVVKHTIEEHEETAEVAFILNMILGVFAIGAFITEFKRMPIRRMAMILTLIVNIAVAGYMAYAGYTGGMIRHTEFSNSNPNVTNTSTGTEADQD